MDILEHVLQKKYEEKKYEADKEILLKVLKKVKKLGKLPKLGEGVDLTGLSDEDKKRYNDTLYNLYSIGDYPEFYNPYGSGTWIEKTADGFSGGWSAHGEVDPAGQDDFFSETVSVTDYEFEKYCRTIDIAELGAEIGMEAKEQRLPNGKVVNSLVWDKENLLKAVKEVKHMSEEGKNVRITGAAPAWLVSALTHTVHPSPVGLYVPAIDKDVEIPSLPHGEANPEGEVGFKVTEKGDAVLIEYNMELPEGITTYDENNLSKVVVPEISKGKAVYISGRGPNYLTVAIAEAYAHTNSSVSLYQPGVGYTCSITHSREKGLGDLTKDPLMVEEIKEDIISSKNTKNTPDIPSV